MSVRFKRKDENHHIDISSSYSREPNPALALKAVTIKGLWISSKHRFDSKNLTRLVTELLEMRCRTNLSWAYDLRMFGEMLQALDPLRLQMEFQSKSATPHPILM